MATGLATLFKGSELLNPECYGRWSRDSQRQVDIVQGSFLLIERDFWNELGGFDLDFFMFGEEADLAARARKAGAAPLMTPEATIIHHGGRSTKHFAKRIIYIFGGRIGLIRRHFTGFWRPFGIGLTVFWVWWRAWSYKVMARIKPHFAQQSREWGTAWESRTIWLKGPPSRPL